MTSTFKRKKDARIRQLVTALVVHLRPTGGDTKEHDDADALLEMESNTIDAVEKLMNHTYMEVNEHATHRRTSRIVHKFAIACLPHHSRGLEYFADIFLQTPLNSATSTLFIRTREHYALLDLMFHLSRDPTAHAYRLPPHLRLDVPSEFSEYDKQRQQRIKLHHEQANALSRAPVAYARRRYFSLAAPHTLSHRFPVARGSALAHGAPLSAPRSADSGAPSEAQLHCLLPLPVEETSITYDSDTLVLPLFGLTLSLPSDDPFNTELYRRLARVETLRCAQKQRARRHSSPPPESSLHGINSCHTTEQCLIEDLCGALQGETSLNTLKYDRRAGQYVIRKDAFAAPSAYRPKTAVAVVSRILEIASNMFTIRETISQLHGDRHTQSDAMAALSIAFETVTVSWNKTILHLMTVCKSLLELHMRVKRIARSVMDLYPLVNALSHSDWMSVYEDLREVAMSWLRVRGPIYRQRHSSKQETLMSGQTKQQKGQKASGIARGRQPDNHASPVTSRLIRQGASTSEWDDVEADNLFTAVPRVFKEVSKVLVGDVFNWVTVGKMSRCLAQAAMENPPLTPIEEGAVASISDDHQRAGSGEHVREADGAETNAENRGPGSRGTDRADKARDAVLEEQALFEKNEDSSAHHRDRRADRTAGAEEATDGEFVWHQSISPAHSPLSLIRTCARDLINCGKSSFILSKMHQRHEVIDLKSYPVIQRLKVFSSQGDTSDDFDNPARRMEPAVLAANTSDLLMAAVNSTSPSSQLAGGFHKADAARSPNRFPAPERQTVVDDQRGRGQATAADKMANQRSRTDSVFSVFECERMVSAAVATASRVLGRSVIASLEAHFELSRHLRALQAFYLQENGPLSAEWLRILRAKLHIHSPALCSCELSDACATFHPFLEDKLNVVYQRPATPNPFSGLTVSMEIPPLLGAVITSSHMELYNELLQTVLFVKSARSSLSAMDTRARMIRGYTHKLLLLRQRLLHFTRAIEDFFTHRIVATSEKHGIHTSISHADGVDDAFEMHEAFLADVRKSVILPRTLRDYVFNLLLGSLRFVSIVTADTASITDLAELRRIEKDAYFMVKAIVHVLESPEARQYPHLTALVAQLSGGHSWLNAFNLIL